MINITKKQVIANNSLCRSLSVYSYLLPIFGLVVILSALEIIPKLPITEDMSFTVAILILAASLLISFGCRKTITNTATKISRIITDGELIMGTVTSSILLKRYTLFDYEFEYENKKEKGNTQIPKKHLFKRPYKKDDEIEIYALRDENGKVLSTVNLYI
jgi:hypothetical protein